MFCYRNNKVIFLKHYQNTKLLLLKLFINFENGLTKLRIYNVKSNTTKQFEYRKNPPTQTQSAQTNTKREPV